MLPTVGGPILPLIVNPTDGSTSLLQLRPGSTGAKAVEEKFLHVFAIIFFSNDRLNEAGLILVT